MLLKAMHQDHSRPSSIISVKIGIDLLEYFPFRILLGADALDIALVSQRIQRSLYGSDRLGYFIGDFAA